MPTRTAQTTWAWRPRGRRGYRGADKLRRRHLRGLLPQAGSRRCRRRDQPRGAHRCRPQRVLSDAVLGLARGGGRQGAVAAGPRGCDPPPGSGRGGPGSAASGWLSAAQRRASTSGHSRRSPRKTRTVPGQQGSHGHRYHARSHAGRLGRVRQIFGGAKVPPTTPDDDGGRGRRCRRRRYFHYRLLENKQGLAGSPLGAPSASAEIYGTCPRHLAKLINVE